MDQLEKNDAGLLTMLKRGDIVRAICSIPACPRVKTGMSGVVYGLLGYAWMKGRFDPGSGLLLHPQTVAMMLIWFFLCLTGLMGNIANTAHAVGLVLGIAWGYASSQMAHRR